MSDLLAVILIVMEDEVDSFWCFAALMEIYGCNFDFDQVGMRTNLDVLSILMRFLEPSECDRGVYILSSGGKRRGVWWFGGRGGGTMVAVARNRAACSLYTECQCPSRSSL